MAGVVELADTQDLKSCGGFPRTGSSPVPGIISIEFPGRLAGCLVDNRIQDSPRLSRSGQPRPGPRRPMARASDSDVGFESSDVHRSIAHRPPEGVPQNKSIGTPPTIPWGSSRKSRTEFVISANYEVRNTFQPNHVADQSSIEFRVSAGIHLALSEFGRPPGWGATAGRTKRERKDRIRQ